MSKSKKQTGSIKKEETCVIVDTARDQYSNELLSKVESFMTDIQTKLIGIMAVNHSELNFGNILICDKAGIMSSISESIVNEISQFTAELNKNHYNK